MSDESVHSKRKPRKKVTLETYLQKHDTLIKYLDAEIDHKSRHKEKGVKSLQSIRKMVRELQRDAPKIATGRKRKTSGKPRKSGFASQYQITEELAKFMQIPPDSTPTLNEITNAIYIYIKIKPGEERPQMIKWKHLNPDNRDLQNPDNRTVIIPDKKLSKLLGYKKYKKDVADGKVTINKIVDKRTKERKTVLVEDDSLFYYVIQKLIQKQIIKAVASKEKEKEI